METKFFTGNYSLSLGQPFVIISAKDNGTMFSAERIIFFQGFDGQKIILANNVNHPKIDGTTIEEFISSEILMSQNDIFYKILYPKYETQLSQKNYIVNIDLKETNRNVLSLLHGKFPDVLSKIKNHTANEKLKSLIGLYQSITIERNDFDISPEN